jgi:hypothetical protein
VRIARSSTWLVLGMLAVLGIVSASSRHESAVTLLIDTQNPGATIPADFAGLSFETETLLPEKNGAHYFSKSNRALIETFNNLGIKSLRVGGNTADRPTVPFPNTADVDSLFSFANSAAANVIFTFRLRAGGPKDAAPLAKHITDLYGSRVVCFAIGNEPDIYAKTYPAYRAELERYMSVFTSFGVSPVAKFCGPGTTPSQAEWAREFAHDFGHSNRVRFVTQHAYPGNSARKVTDTAAARSAILSPEWVESYESFYRSFVPADEADRVPYRMEETNSFFHGGAKDVSDTFASALWALDYMHWWASHGAAGINFHTGEQVAAADETTPCFYAVFLASNHGYMIQPLGYAMKAFDLGGHGRELPVRLASASRTLNLTAYAVSSDENLYVTLINKEHGLGAHDAAVALAIPTSYTHAERMRLEGPGGDISAKTGLKLGGAAIEDNASWNGTWQTLEVGKKTGQFQTTVPAGSAAIVRLSKQAQPQLSRK